jgi:hypothetical protein
MPAISPAFTFPAALLLTTSVEVLRLAAVDVRGVDCVLVGIGVLRSLQELPCQPESQYPMEHLPSILLHDVLLKQ